MMMSCKVDVLSTFCWTKINSCVILIFADEQEGLGMKLQYYYALVNFNLTKIIY